MLASSQRGTPCDRRLEAVEADLDHAAASGVVERLFGPVAEVIVPETAKEGQQFEWRR